MDQSRRTRPAAIALPAIFAGVLLTQTTARPSMAAARSVDVISLVIAGFLLGIAVAQIAAIIKDKR